MTTDITELAQREKFEAWAEERCALPWGYLKNRRTNTGYFSKHDYTSLWAAWKAAGAELVEALEKAQHEARVDWEAAASLNVENQELKRRIAELEDAEQKLCAANVTLDARAELAERQLAEMVSRTVTVKMPKLKMLEDYLAEVAVEERKAILLGVRMEFHRALNAEGIKWEAE
ncbi:TPA: hypothetical protein ACTYTR_003812 [Klebsiella michiganensis]|uniref:hypothetical protein n=1 Tax=Klebsiella michiganensis TaxID=1134687 RepID=UPI0012B7C669|nr:hypothetical protein [Klebsiella michiganensis]ELO7627234.1 hypothetical protein [Klebsiella michiganensis]QWA87618.1 hypothetical protein KLH67_15625 [Klebsiella michiganensis]HDX8758153.1 hypothetical protein [Klebsiella michiganensis]